MFDLSFIISAISTLADRAAMPVFSNADQLMTNADQLKTDADQLMTNADQLKTDADQLMTNADQLMTKGVELINDFWKNIIGPFIMDLNVNIISTTFLLIICIFFGRYLFDLWSSTKKLEQDITSVNNEFKRAEVLSLLDSRKGDHDHYDFINKTANSSEHLEDATLTSDIKVTDAQRREYQSLEISVSKAMKNNKALEHKWNEFSENLISSSEDSLKKRNSLQPESFFDVDDIIEEGVKQHGKTSLQHIHNAPSLFVGLGALGTFLGLTIGVTKVGGGLNDLNKLDQNVGELLSSAGLAFVTSLFGLGASVIFSWFEKMRISTIRSHVKNMVKNLEKMFEFTPSEKILNELDKKSAEQCHKLIEIEKRSAAQCQALEGFSSDLTEALQAAMEESCGKPLKEAISQMTSSLNELKQIQTSFSDNLLKQLVDKMSGNMLSGVEKSQQEAARLTEELKQALSKAVDQVQNGLKEAVTKGVDESNKAVQGVAESMQTMINQSTEELSSMTEATQAKHREALEQFTNSFAEILQKHKEVNESVKNLVQAAQTSAQQQNDLIAKQGNLMDRHEQALATQLTQSQQFLSNFEKVVDHQKEVLEGLQNCADKLLSSSQSLSSTEAHISQHLQALKEATQQFKTSNSELKSIWQGYEERFKDVDQHIKQAVESLVPEMHKLIQVYQGYIRKTSDEFRKALGGLEEAIELLFEALPPHTPPDKQPPHSRMQ